MKVLFITNLPTPYRIDFYSELGKLCDLTVVIEAKRSSTLTFNWNDDKISTFKAIYLNNGNLNENKVNWNIINFLSKEKYDKIVISCYHTRTSMLAILYMKLRHIPYIIETDGGLINYNESSIKRKVKSFFLSNANYYFSPSLGSDEYLQYYGAEKKKIFRYPFTSLNESDIIESVPSEKEKDKLKKELLISEDFVILSIGQFIKRKGFDILLQAVKQINESKGNDIKIGFYIIGGEPTSEYIEMKKKWNLNNVHFISFKSKEDLVKYYKSANLFVLPTREDIWGLVINEAMSYGLPVITTNRCVSGVELLSPECIIETENHVLLKEKIENLINDSKLLSQLSQSNLIKIRNYTTAKMALIHNNIFLKL